MAWSTPKTWASEPLTSVDLNTYIRDNQNYLKDRVDGVADQYAGSGHTTTSTSYVDVDATNMAFTLTTTGKDVLVTCTLVTSHTINRYSYFQLDVDGTAQYALAYSRHGTGSEYQNLSCSQIISGLSAGSHTFKLQWRGNTSDTITLRVGFFDVREIVGEIAS